MCQRNLNRLNISTQSNRKSTPLSIVRTEIHLHPSVLHKQSTSAQLFAHVYSGKTCRKRHSKEGEVRKSHKHLRVYASSWNLPEGGIELEQNKKSAFSGASLIRFRIT
mmetsp:Transcript_20870/g.60749  ORF Transcript_20870/g.60749 Transcript_20870/m.60749 type:complete len:108 (-) Transcript_20870:508-831(-)